MPAEPLDDDQPAVPQATDGLDEPAPPSLPWNIVMPSPVTHYIHMDGNIVLCLTPAFGGGQQITPPQIRVVFDAASWAAFKAEIERGGHKSRIQTAAVLPPGVAT